MGDALLRRYCPKEGVDTVVTHFPSLFRNISVVVGVVVSQSHFPSERRARLPMKRPLASYLHFHDFVGIYQKLKSQLKVKAGRGIVVFSLFAATNLFNG